MMERMDNRTSGWTPEPIADGDGEMATGMASSAMESEMPNAGMPKRRQVLL